VALERETILRSDFPVGAEGYDRAAVDAHLRRVADEVEELQRSTHGYRETLAAATGEQVRAIVEAAERSAAEIHRQAEQQGAAIRNEAATEAHATRDQAIAEAREHLAKVSAAATMTLQRLEATENELRSLSEGLRAGGHHVDADLQRLHTSVAELHDAVGPRPGAGSEPAPGVKSEAAPHRESEPPPARESEPAPQPPPSPERETGVEEYGEPVEGPAPPPAPGGPPAGVAEPVPSPPGNGTGSRDAEAARLVALNMALDGTAREETARYLAEHFALSDHERLLDEVYARVGGN
jgi:DivIVA domain-containing protein